MGSGLEWIGSAPQKVEEILPVEEAACSLIEAVAPAVQTNQVNNVNDMPSTGSYEELLSRYEYHAQQLQLLQLPLLEARLSKALAEHASLEKRAPKKAKKVASGQRGLPEGWARITVIMREEI